MEIKGCRKRAQRRSRNSKQRRGQETAVMIHVVVIFQPRMQGTNHAHGKSSIPEVKMGILHGETSHAWSINFINIHS